MALPIRDPELPDPFVLSFPLFSSNTPWTDMLKLLAGVPSSIVQTHPAELHASVSRSWQATYSLFILNILYALDKPLAIIGTLLEIYLNVVRVNGGFFQMLFKLLVCRDITVPSKDSRQYLSVVGSMDLRKNLMKVRSLQLKWPENDKRLITESKAFACLCVLAAKLAYENEAVIEYVINSDWKMNFVKFYNCWNDHLSSYTTQAFIFKDKSQKAEFIVLAFRGTEPFDAKDWSTDFDFSWYNLPGLGKIHVGFTEALGLGNRSQVQTFMQLKRNCQLKTKHGHSIEFTSGLPSAVLNDPAKPLAFDAINKTLRELLEANPSARLCITGHSLGGALAVVFTAILLYQNDQKILERLAAIYTFGQPRIGDQNLANFMEKGFREYMIKYNRLVYLNDIVPRVPADDPILQYRHFGRCCYFNIWYQRQILPSEPNKNYFSPFYLAAIHVSALYELVQSMLLWLVYGDAFRETLWSTVIRIMGLIVPGISDHSLVNYINSVLLGPCSYHN